MNIAVIISVSVPYYTGFTWPNYSLLWGYELN